MAHQFHLPYVSKFSKLTEGKGINKYKTGLTLKSGKNTTSLIVNLAGQFIFFVSCDRNLLFLYT